MASRLAAAAVALVLVFATGMAGSVSYLCWMDGQVRSTCCCEGEQGQASDCAKVERDDACCKVRVAEVQSQPATSEDRSQNDGPPGPLAWVRPPSTEVSRPGSDLASALGARAPPGGIGPPIYVLHCRFLI